MVQAIDRVPERHELRLVMAGTFGPATLVEQLVAQRGWAKTKMVGFLARPDLARLLSEARMGLVLFHPAPNHTEAQPNKLFEYMSAGIPVVASDFPLWRQIVEGAGCGLLVDPLDPRAIAEAMEWLLDHRRPRSCLPYTTDCCAHRMLQG
jgi:glycosyltransferase involved in cell wall biosynthesis